MCNKRLLHFLAHSKETSRLSSGSFICYKRPVPSSCVSKDDSKNRHRREGELLRVEPLQWKLCFVVVQQSSSWRWLWHPTTSSRFAGCFSSVSRKGDILTSNIASLITTKWPVNYCSNYSNRHLCFKCNPPDFIPTRFSVATHTIHTMHTFMWA